MRRRPRAAGLPLASLVVGAMLPFVGPAQKADALFRYFARKDLAQALAAEPDKWAETDVTVTDELAFVWATDKERDTDQKSKAVYTRFDTVYFSCAVEASKKGDYLDPLWETTKGNLKDVLDELSKTKDTKARRDLYLKAHDKNHAPPLVTLFGKLSRADFFTPPHYLEGKNTPEPEAKAAPEHITIVCERIEKPRQRFFEDLDD